MDREELFDNLEKLTVGLDDTFKFHCNQCGKCCTYRDDIILSPRDIYKMSKELQMSPAVFFQEYCQSHIGDVSRIPIVTLRPVGKDYHCPLLKNNKCIVHRVKPAVCALYPLGRYISADSSKDITTRMDLASVKYLLQPIECGDDSQTQTVREWLSGFEIELEDEYFIQWNTAIQEIGDRLKQLEKTQDMMAMVEIWGFTRILLYLRYDIRKPISSQFHENVAMLKALLKDPDKMRSILAEVRRDAFKWRILNGKSAV